MAVVPPSFLSMCQKRRQHGGRGAGGQGKRAFPETLSLCLIGRMSVNGAPCHKGIWKSNFAGHTATLKQNWDPVYEEEAGMDIG